jgi:hypothetical protein
MAQGYAGRPSRAGTLGGEETLNFGRHPGTHVREVAAFEVGEAKCIHEV